MVEITLLYPNFTCSRELKFNPSLKIRFLITQSEEMARVTWRGVLLYVRLSLIVGLHGVFVLLALLRALSGGFSPSWYAVFSPLFLFDALSTVYWFLYLFSYLAVRRDEDSLWSGRNSAIFPGQRISLLYLVAFGVGLPLKFAAEVLLALHLEKDVGVAFFVPGILLAVLFLETALVAGYEAVSPMLRLAWATIERDVDFEDCGCLNCLGYTNLYCRRCLYHVCVACTRAHTSN